jgi:hypothetical protein
VDRVANPDNTPSVNPLYYVTFTTATLCASFIMFKGFNTTDVVNTLSLLSGFLVIFSGVYLLNLSRKDPVGDTLLGSAQPGRHGGFEDAAIPTDSMTAFGTRRSMQARRSSVDGLRHSRQSSWGSLAGRRSLGDRDGLMQDFALTELAEDSEDDLKVPNGNSRRKPDEEQGTGRSHLTTGPPRLSGSGRPRAAGQKGATSRTTER